MIKVVIGIEEGQKMVHQIIVEVQGEEISVESCVEEMRTLALKWATTWLRYDDFVVTISNKTRG